MSDRDYWTKVQREAEQELDAARTRSALSAAAKRGIRAKAELKRLERLDGTKREAPAA